jgi:hypothetical protein
MIGCLFGVCVAYVVGVIWVGIGTLINPVWEPMSRRTKVKLALLWPYHLVSEKAYSKALWDDYVAK